MKRAQQTQIVEADSITFAWTCVICRKTQTTETRSIQRDGGCYGHTDGEYCYCSSEESFIETTCRFCHAAARVKAK